MLLALMNRSLTWLKMIARITRPRTAGRAPGSPERSLPTYSRPASAMLRSSTSREKLLARSAPRAGGEPAGGVAPGTSTCSVVRSLMSDPLVGGGRRQAEVAAAAAGDELDDLGHGAVAGLHLGGHPPEEEGDHAVGHGHHVVHVVADEHHAEALVGQAPDQFEHLLGLRHTERGGGLVEEDDLALPEHRLGDGHRLPLAA